MAGKVLFDRAGKKKQRVPGGVLEALTAQGKVALKMAPEFGYQTMVRQDPAQPEATVPDRTKERALPLPGSATPGGEGRDIGKFESNTPNNDIDKRPRSLPEEGEDRGHPTNDNMYSFSRRTMTASRPEMVWDAEDFEGDPWQLAKAVGVNILSNKDFAAGYAVNGEIVAALFDASSNDEYEFDVAVRKDWQRKGLGARLMDVALDTFEENREAYGEDYALSLDVISPVAARMLKKRGLVEVGREGGHILMTKRADKAEEGLEGTDRLGRMRQNRRMIGSAATHAPHEACAACVAERYAADISPPRERGGENGKAQSRQKRPEAREDRQRYRAQGPSKRRKSKRWYHTVCKRQPKCLARRKEWHKNKDFYKRRAPKTAQPLTVIGGDEAISILYDKRLSRRRAREIKEDTMNIPKLRSLLASEGLTKTAYDPQIGSVSANIGGDHRYWSRLKLTLKGGKVHFEMSSSSAIGGSDGPGGSYPAEKEDLGSVPITGKAVAEKIKEVMWKDDILKSYGKLKDFEWSVGNAARYHGFERAKGVSIGRAQKVLDSWTMDRDAWGAKWDKPKKAPAAPVAVFDFSGVKSVGDFVRVVEKNGYKMGVVSARGRNGAATLKNGRQSRKFLKDFLASKHTGPDTLQAFTARVFFKGKYGNRLVITNW